MQAPVVEGKSYQARGGEKSAGKKRPLNKTDGKVETICDAHCVDAK
jgi:hypothetical protein